MSALLTLAVLFTLGYLTSWQVAVCVWAVMLLHKINWHSDEMSDIWVRIKELFKGE